jgi:uncharacterized protein
MKLNETEKKIHASVAHELLTEKVASPDHIERMTGWCRKIGQSENVDMEALVAGALVHDIGVTIDRKMHFLAGKGKARKILRVAGFQEAKIEDALHVLESHSRYGGPRPETMEAKVGQDADALEYIGAIGILRAVVRGLTDGSFSGRISEFPDYLRALLTKVEGTFHTDTAREIGARRIAYMRAFLDHIEKELEGEV